MSDVDKFLSHYGVKGMRWGQRRRRSGGKVEVSEDAKRASEIRLKAKTKSVKSLSNQEIREFATRIQLENQFRNATPSNARKVLNTVRDILGVKSTMDQVATFSNSASGQAIRSSLEKRRSNAPASQS